MLATCRNPFTSVQQVCGLCKFVRHTARRTVAVLYLYPFVLFLFYFLHTGPSVRLSTVMGAAMCHTGEVSNVQQVVVVCRGVRNGIGRLFCCMCVHGCIWLKSGSHTPPCETSGKHYHCGYCGFSHHKTDRVASHIRAQHKPDGPGYADGDASDASGEENADEPPPTAACRYHVTTKNACSTWGASKGLFTFAIHAKTNCA